MDPQTSLSISDHRLDKGYSDPSGVDLHVWAFYQIILLALAACSVEIFITYE